MIKGKVGTVREALATVGVTDERTLRALAISRYDQPDLVTDADIARVLGELVEIEAPELLVTNDSAHLYVFCGGGNALYSWCAIGKGGGNFDNQPEYHFRANQSVALVICHDDNNNSNLRLVRTA